MKSREVSSHICTLMTKHVVTLWWKRKGEMSWSFTSRNRSGMCNWQSTDWVISTQHFRRNHLHERQRKLRFFRQQMETMALSFLSPSWQVTFTCNREPTAALLRSTNMAKRTKILSEHRENRAHLIMHNTHIKFVCRLPLFFFQTARRLMATQIIHNVWMILVSKMGS